MILLDSIVNLVVKAGPRMSPLAARVLAVVFFLFATIVFSGVFGGDNNASAITRPPVRQAENVATPAPVREYSLTRSPLARVPLQHKVRQLTAERFDRATRDPRKDVVVLFTPFRCRRRCKDVRETWDKLALEVSHTDGLERVEVAEFGTTERTDAFAIARGVKEFPAVFLYPRWNKTAPVVVQPKPNFDWPVVLRELLETVHTGLDRGVPPSADSGETAAVATTEAPFETEEETAAPPPTPRPFVGLPVRANSYAQDRPRAILLRLSPIELQSLVDKRFSILLAVVSQNCDTSCSKIVAMWQRLTKMTSASHPGWLFGVLNVTQYAHFGSRHGVKTYPTILFFSKPALEKDPAFREGVEYVGARQENAVLNFMLASTV